MNSAPTPKPRQHHRTRSDHATEIAEDYVEAIQQITEQSGACRVVDLANTFGVASATVHRTVARLERDGLVKTEPYQPIHLTDRGRRLAARSMKRHDTVMRFLLALGVTEQTAVVDSEGIEHHVSNETLAAMRRFIDSRADS